MLSLEFQDGFPIKLLLKRDAFESQEGKLAADLYNFGDSEFTI